jgi:hypothetical protein
MQSKRLLHVLAAFLLLLTVSVITAPMVGAAAQVEVSATEDPAEFVVQVSGFHDNEEVSTWLTGPSQQVQASNYHTVNDRGRHTIRLHMARHFQPGRWAITVHGLESDHEAIGYFTLAYRGPDVLVTISPSVGPPGGIFTVLGNGFRAKEIVSYWLTGPDGVARTGGYVQVNETGQVNFVHALDPAALTGWWAISVYGLTSDHLGMAVFQVQSA